MPKNIPVLHVSGKTLPEAYERSIVELMFNGDKMKTQYDKESEPASLDATMDITVENPEADPMIYKLFPGGIEDLREYVMELSGAKDHWVKNMDDPEDKRWEYTYHQRLAAWGSWKEKAGTMCVVPAPIDQIAAVVKKLVETPYTRRAQAITWMPFVDNDVYDPPCLQSMWFRMVEDKSGVFYLNTNIRFRSNDAWGAAYMNMFGLTQFIRSYVANPIEKELGTPVKLGRLNWKADSYHIYGKDINNAFERMIKRIITSEFEERVWNFSDSEIQEIWHETEDKVKAKIQQHDEDHRDVHTK